MGWFKVHSDDLHKFGKAGEIIPVEEIKESEPVKVKTRDVELFVATFRSDLGGVMYYGRYGPSYIRGEVITRTNARDAFFKGVQELMNANGFDPYERYTVSVDKKTVKEPV